jgi:hypothetical protein
MRGKMLRILFGLGATLLLPAVASASPLALAVMDLQSLGTPQEAVLGASELLRAEFVKNPLFNVIERSRLDEILGEQSIQLSGLTDSARAVTIGRIVNARKIVVGSLSSVPGRYVEYLLSVRLVDVETGSVEIAETVEVPTKESLLEAVRHIVAQVGSGIKLVGEVSVVQENTVYVNLGQAAGLAPGMYLQAFDVELIKDRDGQILFREERSLAFLRVLAVDEQGSRCEALSGADQLREGTAVRLSDAPAQETLEERQKGSVRFISVPSGAKAYLNGELVGITPITVQELEEARYTFEIRLAGYKPYAGKINLTRGRDIAVERELEELVEIEEILGGQLIARKPTDPSVALRRALLPGAGQYYNGYESTGIVTGVMTALASSGCLLHSRQYFQDSNLLEGLDDPATLLPADRTYWNVYDYYGSTYDSSYRLVTMASLGGVILLNYLYSIYDSKAGAREAVRRPEYVELKFGAYGYLTGSSQSADLLSTPDRFPSPTYENHDFDQAVSGMSGMDFGGVLSFTHRSRRLDSSFEFYLGGEITGYGFLAHLKFPFTDKLAATLGYQFFSNTQQSNSVEYRNEDPVSMLRDVNAATVGFSFQSPSFLCSLDVGPYALGAADLFFTQNQNDLWVDSRNVFGLKGILGRVRIDGYFGPRFGISLEGRYVYFYDMWNDAFKDLGGSVFERHQDLMVTLSPVFRF